MVDRFQVAVSFAGPQRDYATRVIRALQAYGVTTFLDSDNRADMWGKNLAEYFGNIFSTESMYVVMLISQDYIDREWCRHERRSAIDRMLKEKREVILPVKFDSSWPDGMPTSIGYQDSSVQPEVLAQLICQKLGINTVGMKMSMVPPPVAPSTSGPVTFDYSNNNGRYIIGSPPYEFETVWSQGGGNVIVLYNDSPSVAGVAVADGVIVPAGLTDVSQFDFTSRSRRPFVGQYAVLKNVNGFFAVLHVKNIASRSHGSSKDELSFFYVIRDDKGVDFSSYTFT